MTLIRTCRGPRVAAPTARLTRPRNGHEGRSQRSHSVAADSRPGSPGPPGSGLRRPRVAQLGLEPWIVEPDVEPVRDPVGDSDFPGAFPTPRMPPHQRRDVHQVLRTAGLELEPDQAIEVDDADAGASSERDGDGQVPLDGTNGGRTSKRMSPIAPLRQVKEPRTRSQGRTLLAQALPRRCQVPDDEVHVRGGPNVAVGADRQPAHQHALVLADPGDSQRDVFERARRHDRRPDAWTPRRSLRVKALTSTARSRRSPISSVSACGAARGRGCDHTPDSTPTGSSSVSVDHRDQERWRRTASVTCSVVAWPPTSVSRSSRRAGEKRRPGRRDAPPTE